ncbi:MAG: nuclear transport factor 2 family protein [Acetobacteraceae bacterium]
MHDFNGMAGRYIQVWNETDPLRRRTLIAASWVEDADYRDPMATVAGHQGIESLIAGVQQKFPGLRFRLLGVPDGHGDRFRFRWGLGPADSDPVAEGTDFAVLASDGRLASVTGFIDRMPG